MDHELFFTSLNPPVNSEQQRITLKVDPWLNPYGKKCFNLTFRKKSTTIPLQCASIKVWEDSHGEVEKDMKQVLFLPHEILGSMISAGRLDLVAGTSVTQPNFMWRKAHQKKTRFPIQSLKRLQVAAMLAPRHYRNSGTTCGTPRGSKTIRF